MTRLTKLPVALLALVTSTQVGASPFLIGVCTHPHEDGYSVSMLSKAFSRSGITSYRSSISWQYVEKVKGRYAIPSNYRTTDDMLLRAKSLGVDPLVILDYGNPLYQEDGLVTTREARQGFVDYARWMASRYKGKVHHYEIWNEWYIGLGSRAKPRRVPSVEDYVALLRLVYPALKQVDPDIVVVGGGAGEGDSAWFDRFILLGGLQFVDGVSIHPYNYGRGPGNNTPEASLAWVDQVHSAIARADSGEKSLYVTEIGWPSHSIGYDDSVVAAYISRFYLLAKAKGYISGVWWYDLYNDGPDRANREHNFGLLDRDGAVKPAFRALSSIAPMLRSLSDSRLEASGTTVSISATGNDGLKRLFSWSPIAIPSRKAVLANYEGDTKVLLEAYDGRLPEAKDWRQFRLAASQSPIPFMFLPISAEGAEAIHGSR